MDVNESIERNLRQLEGEESTRSVIHVKPPGVDGISHEESHIVPVYELARNAQLWQVTQIPPGLFWDFYVSRSGMVVRLSEWTVAVFLFDLEGQFTSENHIRLAPNMNGDESDYIAAGPTVYAFDPLAVGGAGAVVCQTFVSVSAIPLDDAALHQTRLDLKDTLQFLVSLPSLELDQPYNRYVWFRGTDDFQTLRHMKDCYAIEGLQECFDNDEWNNGTAIFQMESFEPSVEQWAFIESLELKSIRMECMAFPFTVLQNTKALLAVLYNVQMQGPTTAHSTAPTTTNTSLRVIFDKDALSLDTDASVDQLLDEYMSLSQSIQFYRVSMSNRGWLRFWSSPVMSQDTTCQRLLLEDWHIDGAPMTAEHALLIPNRQWMFCLINNDGVNEGQQIDGIHGLTLFRIPCSFTTEEMNYFRPELNPFLAETPPFDFSHLALQEFLHRHSNDASTIRNLLQHHLATLVVQPRSAEAIAHDMETSIIELRGHVIDHQAILDIITMSNQEHHVEQARDQMALLSQLDEECQNCIADDNSLDARMYFELGSVADLSLQVEALRQESRESQDAMQAMRREHQEQLQESQDAMQAMRREHQEQLQESQDATETMRREHQEQLQESQDATEAMRREHQEQLQESQDAMQAMRQEHQEQLQALHREHQGQQLAAQNRFALLEAHMVRVLAMLEDGRGHGVNNS
ncbi:hypothetical protein MPSEU_001083900 [Mayamaea pseudoterrestris]|nr:hypothetical protein MPSEU_001083900 [Mayamaea pseudoterrestris]